MFPIGDDRPKYSAPVVTILIIVVNAMVFLHEASLEPYSRNYFLMHYGLVPDADRFRLPALVTSMFLHGGWLHIISNMLFLWAFGRSLEDTMGGAKYLAFYLLCGIAAGLTQVYFNLGSRAPMVGASGAIAGIMGGYLVKFPRARIHTLIFLLLIWNVEIPAVVILVYWFVTQFFNAVGSIGYSHVSEGGTAWFAHVGGFITGIILVNLLGTQQRYYRRNASW